MRLHPHRKRLCAPLGEITIVRTRHGADGILQEAQFCVESVVVYGEDGAAHYDIRVTVDVLGERVDDNVCSE